MKKIQVGLIGFGTVGSGLAQTLLEQKDRLLRKVGTEIALTMVADIMIDKLPEQFSDITLTKDANELFTNPDIDIVVELIGGMSFP